MEFWNSVETRREKKGVGLRLVRWACDLCSSCSPQWSMEEVDDFAKVNGEIAHEAKGQGRRLCRLQLCRLWAAADAQARVMSRPPRAAARRSSASSREHRQGMAAVGTMPANARYRPKHQFPKKGQMRLSVDAGQVVGRDSIATAERRRPARPI